MEELSYFFSEISAARQISEIHAQKYMSPGKKKKKNKRSQRHEYSCRGMISNRSHSDLVHTTVVF